MGGNELALKTLEIIEHLMTLNQSMLYGLTLLEFVIGINSHACYEFPFLRFATIANMLQKKKGLHTNT